jgi:hypothetical protein
MGAGAMFLVVGRCSTSNLPCWFTVSHTSIHDTENYKTERSRGQTSKQSREESQDTTRQEREPLPRSFTHCTDADTTLHYSTLHYTALLLTMLGRRLVDGRVHRGVLLGRSRPAGGTALAIAHVVTTLLCQSNLEPVQYGTLEEGRVAR